LKYWLNVGFLEVAQLVPVARTAEDLGFEGVALADHLFFPAQVDSPYPYSADGAVAWPTAAPWPDCWVAIAALAQATTRLRLTTAVLVAPLRDVFSLAKASGTAAGFGPGRVSCGLGAGWLREEFDIVGRDFATRGARLDEMIDALRQLWSGETVDFAGGQLSFGPVQMRPAVPALPILTGGNSPAALRRAARNEGWIGTYTNLDDVGRLVGDLGAERCTAGRSGDAFETLLAATPGVLRHVDALDSLGVDGLILPAVALAASPSTDDVLAGLGRFAERWLP